MLAQEDIKLGWQPVLPVQEAEAVSNKTTEASVATAVAVEAAVRGILPIPPLPEQIASHLLRQITVHSSNLNGVGCSQPLKWAN